MNDFDGLSDLEMRAERVLGGLSEYHIANVQMKYKEERGLQQDQNLDYKDRLSVAIRVARKPMRVDVESPGFDVMICRLASEYVFRPVEDYGQYFGSKERSAEVVKNVTQGLLRIAKQSAEKLKEEYMRDIEKRIGEIKGDENKTWSFVV